MIVKDLSDFVRLFRRLVTKSVAAFLQTVSQELHPTTQFPANSSKLYAVAASKMSKLVPLLLELITRIGQMQLIRRQIANELNFSAKLDSKLLSSALEAMNLALTNDVRAHYAEPDSKPYPGNPTLPDVSDFLETAGQNTTQHSKHIIRAARSLRNPPLFPPADLFQPLPSHFISDEQSPRSTYLNAQIIRGLT